MSDPDSSEPARGRVSISPPHGCGRTVVHLRRYPARRRDALENRRARSSWPGVRPYGAFARPRPEVYGHMGSVPLRSRSLRVLGTRASVDSPSGCSRCAGTMGVGARSGNRDCASPSLFRALSPGRFRDCRWRKRSRRCVESRRPRNRAGTMSVSRHDLFRESPLPASRRYVAGPSICRAGE